jgi:beta-ribofuranosylaminobenzene 5'-phosphate synthase
MKLNKDIKSITVTTHARLHMGFFDLNGQLGRRFGSIGVGLNYPKTQIRVSVGGLASQSPHAEYANSILQTMLSTLNLTMDINVEVIDQIPRHSGLGSGTQMALAIGEALNQLLDLNMSLDTIATMAKRGSRSGVGIGTFAHGGLVLDGGRGALSSVPPIIARVDFPSEWRILLIFDHNKLGVNGYEEVKAFDTLKNQTQANTQVLAHQVLMQGIPSVVEHDLINFSKVVSALQTYNGDYFSPAQGGKFASQSVAKVLDFLISQAVDAVGQSSWGPTGFAIFPTLEEGERMLARVEQQFVDMGLTFVLCSGLNTGAHVDIEN